MRSIAAEEEWLRLLVQELTPVMQHLHDDKLPLSESLPSVKQLPSIFPQACIQHPCILWWTPPLSYWSVRDHQLHVLSYMAYCGGTRTLQRCASGTWQYSYIITAPTPHHQVPVLVAIHHVQHVSPTWSPPWNVNVD